MNNDGMIRKEVGHYKKVSPLKKAFELNKMLEELRGKRVDTKNENIRKVVGKVK
ncbi:MAG: hypothetical protein PHX78_09550 [bacterium]|nr:hypothetical protein [bacterium]